MQFITTYFLILASLICCSAVVSVGYKTNFKDNSVLIIGEVSNTASSVQISNILRQLRVFRNHYAELILVTVGNRLKVSKKLGCSEATCLYDVKSGQFLEFLRSKISVAIESNQSIQKYFTIYQRPSLLMKSPYENISNEIELMLDETILVDINQIFSENMEVSCTILEYDDVYGTGQSVRSRLLKGRKGGSSEKSNKDHEKCCNLS